MHRSASIRFFATLSLAAALAGCATPQYQTTVRLIPPADAQGRACVQDCEVKSAACLADCQARYQACERAVEPHVEARYVDALNQYELNLRQYAAALRQYELQLYFGWGYAYPRYGFWGWGPWPYYPPPYPPPPMPTREGVRAQLVRENCQDDCGCQPARDACFIGCGGQRISETVCVKNCPPAK